MASQQTTKQLKEHNHEHSMDGAENIGSLVIDRCRSCRSVLDVPTARRRRLSLSEYAKDVEHLRLLVLVGVETGCLTGDQAVKELQNWK